MKLSFVRICEQVSLYVFLAFLVDNYFNRFHFGDSMNPIHDIFYSQPFGYLFIEKSQFKGVLVAGLMRP